jgi:hypothetical protein
MWPSFHRQRGQRGQRAVFSPCNNSYFLTDNEDNEPYFHSSTIKQKSPQVGSKMVDSYHGVLRRLMACLHKVDAYEKDHVFSQDELVALTPTGSDIKRWMCVKASSMPEPGPDDHDHPTECRSSSIEFWKKAISSFMPNRLMQWNALSNVGNPTKSIEVNDLVEAVKKKVVEQVKYSINLRA